MSLSTPSSAPLARAASLTNASMLQRVLHHPLGRPLAALFLLLLVDFFAIPGFSIWKCVTAICTAA